MNKFPLEFYFDYQYILDGLSFTYFFLSKHVYYS